MHLLVSLLVTYLSPTVSERQQSVGSLPGLRDEEADIVPEDGHLQQ